MSKKKIILILLSVFIISSIVGSIIYFYKNEKKVLKYIGDKVGYNPNDPKSKEINNNVHYNNSKRQWLYMKEDETIYFSIKDQIKGKEYTDYDRLCYIEDYDEYIYFKSRNSKILPILTWNRIYKTDDIYDANFIYHYLYGKDLDRFLNKINFKQKYCRFPISDYLINKKSLYSHYLKMMNKYPDDYNFMVESYILPQQIDIFERVFKENESINGRNIWIVKPVGLSRGMNIKIVDKLSDIIENVEIKEQVAPNNNNTKNNKNNKNNKKNKNKNKVTNEPKYIIKNKKISKNGNVIVSRYIEPSTINNRKFDLKIMCLITSYDPLMVYLYDDGIVRFATENYSEDKDKLSNKYIHLTNASVNEKNSNYIKNNDFYDLKESVSSLNAFKKYCEDNKIDYDAILSKIKDYVIKAILSNYDSAVQDLHKYKLPSCKNIFELFGVEVILDKDYNPHLIGFNSKPELFTNSKVGEKLYNNVICDLLNIIGIRKYNRKSMRKHRRVYTLEENLKECTKELKRYTGHFELIFPLKNNIDKYSKFIENKTKLNTELWSYFLRN